MKKLDVGDEEVPVLNEEQLEALDKEVIEVLNATFLPLNFSLLKI